MGDFSFCEPEYNFSSKKNYEAGSRPEFFDEKILSCDQKSWCVILYCDRKLKIWEKIRLVTKSFSKSTSHHKNR